MSARVHCCTASKERAQGFTLVELMVGLVLGLLAVLVITQVLALAEGKRRTVSMGSDAQVNGALALFTLQRDIQQSGYGIAQLPSAMGCPTKALRAGGSELNFVLAPVLITDGADGAPDQITVLQASTSGFSTPITITGDHPADATAYVVQSSFGVRPGDMLVAVPRVRDTNNWCTIFNVTHDGATPLAALGPTRIPNATGATGPWNQTSIYPTAGYLTDDKLLNLGQLMWRQYAIGGANRSLQLTELSTATGASTTQELYPQIANLQAFYAKDTNGDGVADTYDATTPSTEAGWQQVLAVRIALVARSIQYEKEEVTPAAPVLDVGTSATVSGTSTCGTSKCISLRVDQVGEDWKHYRYKVYDTLVPLRNVLWNS